MVLTKHSILRNPTFNVFFFFLSLIEIDWIYSFLSLGKPTTFSGLLEIQVSSEVGPPEIFIPLTSQGVRVKVENKKSQQPRWKSSERGDPMYEGKWGDLLSRTERVGDHFFVPEIRLTYYNSGTGQSMVSGSDLNGPNHKGFVYPWELFLTCGWTLSSGHLFSFPWHTGLSLQGCPPEFRRRIPKNRSTLWEPDCGEGRVGPGK